jgi:hypothetical protein
MACYFILVSFSSAFVDEGENLVLFFLCVTQYQATVRNSLPGSPWMEKLHRTCEIS